MFEPSPKSCQSTLILKLTDYVMKVNDRSHLELKCCNEDFMADSPENSCKEYMNSNVLLSYNLMDPQVREKAFPSFEDYCKDDVFQVISLIYQRFTGHKMFQFRVMHSFLKSRKDFKVDHFGSLKYTDLNNRPSIDELLEHPLLLPKEKLYSKLKEIIQQLSLNKYVQGLPLSKKDYLQEANKKVFDPSDERYGYPDLIFDWPNFFNCFADQTSWQFKKENQRDLCAVCKVMFVTISHNKAYPFTMHPAYSTTEKAFDQFFNAIEPLEMVLYDLPEKIITDNTFSSS